MDDSPLLHCTCSFSSGNTHRVAIRDGWEDGLSTHHSTHQSSDTECHSSNANDPDALLLGQLSGLCCYDWNNNGHKYQFNTMGHNFYKNINLHFQANKYRDVGHWIVNYVIENTVGHSKVTIVYFKTTIVVSDYSSKSNCASKSNQFVNHDSHITGT